LPPRASAFELDLEVVFQNAPTMVEATSVKTHPVAKEDLAFVVETALPASQVAQVVGEACGDLLESSQVFDVYQGDQVPAGLKSVAVAIRLRAADHTLSPTEVAEVRNRAVAAVARQLGGSLRV
jgi:phenylalanyl-tRNA synthetase beta chain